MERRPTRVRTTLALAALALTLIAPWGCGQDLTETRRLADQGDVTAQFNLGVSYVNGEGVPQDVAEAVRWYILAADQGDVDAQRNLGLMYLTGDGMPQDEAEAVRWLRLAADQGDVDAQSNLGAMYDLGYGVPQDSVLAHMWFNIASANGNETAAEMRDALEREMPPDEISRATELARTCMASNYQDCQP